MICTPRPPPRLIAEPSPLVSCPLHQIADPPHPFFVPPLDQRAIRRSRYQFNRVLLDPPATISASSACDVTDRPPSSLSQPAPPLQAFLTFKPSAASATRSAAGVNAHPFPFCAINAVYNTTPTRSEDFRKTYQEENPDVKSMREIGRECGEKWKTMTYEEKVAYYDIATEKRAEFEKAVSEYTKRKFLKRYVKGETQHFENRTGHRTGEAKGSRFNWFNRGRTAGPPARFTGSWAVRYHTGFSPLTGPAGGPVGGPTG
ncbi:High mobility group B protein 14 [Platanthera guangdongensis]|uniref:High mobility group B protein 14 n=1 Tax=Platanthera guangdongensis TaxID=2320717 RepID=A0ABR2M5G9_9ASPA